MNKDKNLKKKKKNFYLRGLSQKIKIIFLYIDKLKSQKINHTTTKNKY